MNKIRHIGFTGTREGMSVNQMLSLYKAMELANQEGITNVLHHGDCLGADSEAHDIAIDLGWLVTIHPPKSDYMRAHKCDGAIILPPLEYLDRDRAIVNASNFIFAAPKSDKEELRKALRYKVLPYPKRESGSIEGELNGSPVHSEVQSLGSAPNSNSGLSEENSVSTPNKSPVQCRKSAPLSATLDQFFT